METINIGKVVFSEKVVISDPCYDRDVWCMMNDVSVVPGEYNAYALKNDEGDFGERVASILCFHNDYFNTLFDAMEEKWNEIDSIGVDSGQAGIFDDSIYPASEEEGGEHDNPKSFYGECCEITLGEQQCGILKSKKGFVSSSGYGDGVYTVSAIIKDEKRVAIMVDFGLVKMREVMKKLIADQMEAGD
jgi:hypothetical protein